MNLWMRWTVNTMAAFNSTLSTSGNQCKSNRRDNAAWIFLGQDTLLVTGNPTINVRFRVHWIFVWSEKIDRSIHFCNNILMYINFLMKFIICFYSSTFYRRIKTMIKNRCLQNNCLPINYTNLVEGTTTAWIESSRNDESWYRKNPHGKKYSQYILKNLVPCMLNKYFEQMHDRLSKEFSEMLFQMIRAKKENYAFSRFLEK